MSSTNKLSGLKIPGLAQSIPVLAILMEVFWSYTVLALINLLAVQVWDQPPLSLISCLILAVFTEIVSRASLSGKWSIRRVRWTVLPAIFLLLLILLRLNIGGGYGLADAGWLGYAADQASAIVVGFIFGIYLVWRGISVGRGDNSFSDLYRRFITGLVMIILVLIAWGIAGKSGSIWDNLGIEIVFFFATGLLAMAIANLETLRHQLLQHQEGTGSFSRRWLSMLIVLVLGIVGLGIAAVSIFSSGTGGSIIHFLGILGDWLITAFTYILYPVGFVASGLYYVLRYIISLLRGETAPQFNMSNPGDLSDIFKGQAASDIPTALLLALKWGAIVLFLGLAIFFLARLLTRYWQGKSDEGIDEVHETLGTWKMFTMDLRSILGWLFGWMRRRKAKSGAAQRGAANSLPPDAEPDKVLNIRELYRSLLWQGKQLGIPRKENETPYEYERRLKEYKAGLTDELNTLTEAYIIERYGQTPPEPEKVTWLNRIWKSLKEKFIQSEEL